MATIGELIINLNANTASFVTDLNRVKNLSFDTAAQVQRSFSLIGTAALGMISVAAGALAVGITKTSEWEAHLGHLAQASGMTVESLSGLSYAAKLMGTDIDAMALALERFDKQLIAAQLGNKKAEQNMSLLGIDPAAIKTSDQALMLLADHFSKMPDGILKTGEAMLAFGRSGAQMIPTLNQGAKGMQDFLAEAKVMGVVITTDQAEAAIRWEQNMTRMRESLHGLWVEITNAVIPALNDLMTHFNDTAKTQGKLAAIWQASAAFLSGNVAYMANYMAKGKELIATHDKMRTSITDLSANVKDPGAKAIETFRKSIEQLITTETIATQTVGMSAAGVKLYTLAAEAATLGDSKWAAGKLELARVLEAQVAQEKQIYDYNLRQGQRKIDQEDRVRLLTLETAELQKQLAIEMNPQFSLSSDIGKQSQAFTDSITQQTAALQHQIATFGMSADAIARYDLAQLSIAGSGEKDIAVLQVLQIQYKGLEDAANLNAQAVARNAEAWKQFDQTAERSLSDLIFSGKKFTQVLADITKQLGEMFLKWSLFGFGGKSAGGGGLFGALAGGLSSLFGGGLTTAGGLFSNAAGNAFLDGLIPAFASGGDVSAGMPILVGENGPEIFRPSTAGAIVPNGGGAGGGATINYYVDARGSSITEAQFVRALQVSESRAVQRALGAAREVQLRTG
jgi:hypothetical protein